MGMRAWWPFDEVSGSTAAEIINGNNGTHIGSPVFTPGMVDGALSFNGSTDYVEAPDDPSLDVGTGDFSIDAWIKTSQTDGIAAIIDKREAVCSCDTGMCLGGTEIGYHFFLYYGHLSLQLAAGSGGLTNYISNTSVADGSWHLVAVTVDRDQTDGIKFFVDGIMVESFNPTAYSGMSLDNLSPLTIGSRSPFLCSGSWFNGLIDEVELFGTALDQSDIMSIYNAGSSGKCKDFPCREVAWYPFDEHVGPTASDVVGGNNGTHMNNPLPITGGMVDYALHFDGTNDYVAVPDDPALNFGTGDLSIIAYIRTESKNMESLVDKRDQNTGIGYTFILLNGQLLFQLYDASGWYNYYASSPDLADGEWHCVAVTVDRDDPNGGKLYADGQPVLDFNPTNRPGNITNTAELWIGKHHANPGSSSTKCFDGDMDELKLFKCALTEIEIQAICQESIIFN
ncbi:MAG: LamG domain-containing protein [Hyphomicrobiales bacterium]|nr:LamG domain-containing protein [Hyphomicrobiales bacterium]